MIAINGDKEPLCTSSNLDHPRIFITLTPDTFQISVERSKLKAIESEEDVEKKESKLSNKEGKKKHVVKKRVIAKPKIPMFYKPNEETIGK
jgi:hypothetical protein